MGSETRLNWRVERLGRSFAPALSLLRPLSNAAPFPPSLPFFSYSLESMKGRVFRLLACGCRKFDRT